MKLQKGFLFLLPIIVFAAKLSFALAPRSQIFEFEGKTNQSCLEVNLGWASEDFGDFGWSKSLGAGIKNNCHNNLKITEITVDDIWDKERKTLGLATPNQENSYMTVYHKTDASSFSQRIRYLPDGDDCGLLTQGPLDHTVKNCRAFLLPKNDTLFVAFRINVPFKITGGFDTSPISSAVIEGKIIDPREGASKK
jgi:hypothetical protein